MKIALASDLHLEFGAISLTNDENADVLILSGDIIVAKSLRERDVYGIMADTKSHNDRYHTFFQECSARFKNVIFVCGNHEHYDGDFKHTYTKIKHQLSYLKNVHVLDKEWKEIDGVVFFGGTFWTDMNNGDALTLYHLKAMMNDFSIVENSNVVRHRKVPLYKRNEDGSYLKNENGCLIEDGFKFKEEVGMFSPENAFEDHIKTMQALQFAIQENSDKPFVVASHHAPSKLSTHPRYKHDQVMNGGYSSDKSEFILDHEQIKLWTHGHTHDKFDYKVGETRIVCNPRGYINYESCANTFQLQYIDL